MLLATVPLLAAAFPFVGNLSLHDLLLHGRQFGPDALAVVDWDGAVAMHARLLVDVSLRWSQLVLLLGACCIFYPPLFSAVGDVGLILGLC